MLFTILLLIAFLALALWPIWRVLGIYLLYSESDESKTIDRLKKVKAEVGPWAVVSGGTAGIGREFVEYLAGIGFDCLIISNEEEELNKVKTEVEDKHKVNVKTINFDFAKGDGYSQIRDEMESISSIGILVNNVGTLASGYKFFHETPFNDIATIVNCNLISFFSMQHLFLSKLMSQLRSSKGPIVITIGSGAGSLVLRRMSLYSTTKAAIQQAHLVMQGEATVPLCMNLFVPSYIATRMTAGMPSSRLVPTPKDFVRSAMQFAGKSVPPIAGYWVHDIRQAVFKSMPNFLSCYILNKIIDGIREKQLQLKKKE